MESIQSVTSLIRSIRRLDEYKEWIRAVHLRDRCTCQQCGKRNGRKRVIEAHHIQELSALVRQCHVTTLDEARQCAALWNIGNGLTLCKTCHQQTESYPKQFIKVRTTTRKNEKVNKLSA